MTAKETAKRIHYAIKAKDYHILPGQSFDNQVTEDVAWMNQKQAELQEKGGLNCRDRAVIEFISMIIYDSDEPKNVECG